GRPRQGAPERRTSHYRGDEATVRLAPRGPHTASLANGRIVPRCRSSPASIAGPRPEGMLGGTIIWTAPWWLLYSQHRSDAARQHSRAHVEPMERSDVRSRRPRTRMEAAVLEERLKVGQVDRIDAFHAIELGCNASMLREPGVHVLPSERRSRPG